LCNNVLRDIEADRRDRREILDRLAHGRLPSDGLWQRPSWHIDAARGAVHPITVNRAVQHGRVSWPQRVGEVDRSICASALFHLRSCILAAFWRLAKGKRIA
jgi:hypothetical protein